MHQSLSLLALAAMLLSIATPASADCTTFDVSQARINSKTIQLQRVTAAHYCPVDHHDFGCEALDDKGNVTYKGCSLYGKGTVVATGYTNISADVLAPAAASYLYPLASNALKQFAKMPQHAGGTNFRGIRQNMTQCLHGAFDLINFCVQQGRTGYGTWSPALKCIEGTVSGCSGGGLTDGTPVEVCGPVPFGSTIDYFEYNTTYVSKQDAAKFAVNPAEKRGACTNAGTGLFPPSWALFVSGLMAAASMVML